MRIGRNIGALAAIAAGLSSLMPTNNSAIPFGDQPRSNKLTSKSPIKVRDPHSPRLERAIEKRKRKAAARLRRV